jgi:hypothetical protein
VLDLTDAQVLPVFLGVMKLCYRCQTFTIPKAA